MRSSPDARRPAVLVLLAALAACEERSPASAEPSPPPSALAASSAPATPEPPGAPCGELDCRLFDTPEAAFAAVLEERPLVLAVGEAHAQKGSAGPSVTARFRERLLPGLRGRASDLLVELMLPPKGCAKAEEKVRERHAPVAAKQAETNQNDYVALGEAARSLGLVADALRPSCADLDAISKSGENAVITTLETIARLSAAKVRELLEKNRKSPERADKAVVTYGGALHNDLAPAPGREAWSYGPELERATGGRYVELDVFAPESIQPTDAWRKLAFYPHYDADKFGPKAVLFRPGKASFVLILPRGA